MSKRELQFSHLNAAGEAHMVDVSTKKTSTRTAVARAFISMPRSIIERIRTGGIEKGDLLATARIAGIQAAKKCADLIPLCHPLPLTKISIDLDVRDTGVVVESLCKTNGQTGVEMEALTAASVSALTLYDMCKALDKGIVIETLCLIEKTGGKSGDWHRDDYPNELGRAAAGAVEEGGAL